MQKKIAGNDKAPQDDLAQRVVLKHIGKAAYPLESQLNEGKYQ
jgi:hypothetical protein